MIRILFSVTVVAALGMHGGPALAQWSGGVSAGVVNASGNSKSSSVNATLDISRAAGLWSHDLESEFYRADSDGQEQADQLMLAYKLRREINGSWYGWASTGYTKDQFAGINRRLTAALGVGNHLLSGPVHLLDIEGGLGWRQTRLIDPSQTDAEAIVRAALDYEAKLNESTGFTQKLSVESGSKNTLIESKSGLKVMMSSRLSLVLAFSVRRNSDFAGNRGSNTDTLTTVNIAYSF